MKKVNLLLWLLFILYMWLLFYLVLFSAEFGREASVRNYNLVPFSTISRYVNYRQVFGERNYITNIYGNILAFAPFGYFLFRFQKKKHILSGLVLPFLLSGIIEISQYVLRVGSFDVDDMILNTLGGFIVYLILFIYRKFIVRKLGVTK